MPEVIERSGGSGYGYSGWKPGQTIRNEDFGIGRGEPEYLTVLEAEQQYIRYDGMSFGVGAESGYLYTARCRPATDAEAAPLIAAQAAREAREAARRRIVEIKSAFRDVKNVRDSEHAPEGDQVLKTDKDWFVIGPEYIWHIEVESWGGFIARRMPATAELADELRRLNATATGRKR